MNEALLSDAYIQAIQPLMKGKFTNPELKLAATTVPAETTPDEFAAYMAYCAGLDLNPITGEVHLERKKVSKDRDEWKMTYVVHIDAYRRAAAVQNKLDGIDQVEGMDPDSGYFVDTILHIKGMQYPVKARAYHAEYKVDIGFMWKKKFIMTAKCSESLAYRKAGILVGSISEEEADRDRAEWNGTTTPTDDFKVAEKQPAATTQAAAAPADATKAAEPAKTEPQPTQTVTTAVDASPATNQAQPEPEKKQEAAPRPKLAERINNLATVLEFEDKAVFNPLLVKFQMGYFDKSTAEEVAALREKQYVEQHHAYIDKLESFIKTYGTKFVKAYLTDQPIVLGRFAGGRMDTLPGLPGFKPEAKQSNVTMQALKQAFSKYDLAESILMSLLDLCASRGYGLPELRTWATTNKLTPNDPLLFGLSAVLSREVDNLDPFLAKVRKGGSVNAWEALLAKTLGKAISEADSVELEQAIAKLPDTLPAEEPEDDQAGF
jgi:hypothetical protein